MFLNRLSALFHLSAVRQTLWLLALFSLISLVAWGVTFLLVQRDMMRGVDARLSERMEITVTALEVGGALPTPGDGEMADFYTGSRRDGFETRDAEDKERDMRYLIRTTAHGRVRLGENIERQEELLDILEGGMTTSLLATLFVATLTGLWMARRSQSRLNAINVGLVAVARGDLASRITLDGQDDLSLLADRINATTARLEDAMMQMRVQSSNIAHDLRTPMARLRAQIEGCLIAATEDQRAISPGELDSALSQIDRITGTFEALLRLARIESGAGRNAFTQIDLAALVSEVEETFGPVVEDAGQVLVVETVDAMSIDGDHDLLVQLLANLVQNALRYGTERQTITLRVHGPRLILSDQGPGIPFADREKVLQPLHQGESARQSEGFGLGLSLVRAIADLHGADLTLSDGPNGRGLCVTVQFPKITEL